MIALDSNPRAGRPHLVGDGPVPGQTITLRFRRNRRYQRLDVTKREGESLVTVRVAFDLRYVVRHHHSVEADLFIHAHRFKHIDVAVIDERFLEVQKPSMDVSEMHIEDLAPGAKVADHIEDLFAGIF
jgi:hypothetical protein